MFAVAIAGSRRGSSALRRRRRLPDGYMRAPAVQKGLAPKMRVTETHGPGARVRRRTSRPATRSYRASPTSPSSTTSRRATSRGSAASRARCSASAIRRLGAFKRIPVDEKCELVSLIGHIQMRDGDPYVHLHAVVGAQGRQHEGRPRHRGARRADRRDLGRRDVDRRRSVTEPHGDSACVSSLALLALLARRRRPRRRRKAADRAADEKPRSAPSSKRSSTRARRTTPPGSPRC